MIEDEHQWKGATTGPLTPRFWDPNLRAQIGRDLRAQYDETMEEPLPERLAALVTRLEEQERASGPTLDHDPA